MFNATKGMTQIQSYMGMTQLRRIAKNPHTHYTVNNDYEPVLSAMSVHEEDVAMPHCTILGHLERVVTPSGSVQYVKRIAEAGDGTVIGMLMDE